MYSIPFFSVASSCADLLNSLHEPRLFLVVLLLLVTLESGHVVYQRVDSLTAGVD